MNYWKIILFLYRFRRTHISIILSSAVFGGLDFIYKLIINSISNFTRLSCRAILPFTNYFFYTEHEAEYVHSVIIYHLFLISRWRNMNISLDWIRIRSWFWQYRVAFEFRLSVMNYEFIEICDFYNRVWSGVRMCHRLKSGVRNVPPQLSVMVLECLM